MDVNPTPVPWAQIAAFIRQLSHDLRNDLNALSLEAALVKELANDPEAATSAGRIQTQLRDVANRLKDLSTRFLLPTPKPTEVPLDELAVHLQNATDAASLDWKISESPVAVQTDPVLLARGVRELVANALERAKNGQRPAITLTASPEGGATVTLQEPGASMYPWPETPFTNTRSGHYGVGIYLAAGIFRALGARVHREEKGEILETQIHVPAALAN